jgi:hypothetical protein
MVMAEQSQFSRIPKKQLVLICEQLIDKNFPTNPYESYEYGTHMDTLIDIAKYFGMEVTDEDVQFFSKFIDINSHTLSRIIKTKDKSSYDNLVIPTAKRYKVEYSQYGSCTYTESLETTWNSYDPDWVTDSLNMAREDGNWDLYDGNAIEMEYDNYEMDDFNFNDVTEISDVKESTNKNKIIESLDKKTLLELRGLIDDRLKTL